MLLVERLPFVAQPLDVLRDLRPGPAPAPRWPRRVRTTGEGVALAKDSQRSSSVSGCTTRPDAVVVAWAARPRRSCACGFRRRRRGRLQLSGSERLLGGVPAVQALQPCGARFLLHRPDLLKPALLDHRQRGFEAPRQRRGSDRPIERCQRSGSVALSIEVVGRERSASTTSASAAASASRSCSHRAMRCAASQCGERRIVAVLPRRVAPGLQRRGQRGIPFGRGRGPERAQPFGDIPGRTAPRPASLLLAVEALLDRAPGASQRASGPCRCPCRALASGGRARRAAVTMGPGRSASASSSARIAYGLGLPLGVVLDRFDRWPRPVPTP